MIRRATTRRLWAGKAHRRMGLSWKPKRERSLARNRRFAQNLLQVVSRAAGLECFAYTFVTCAAEGPTQG